MPGSGIYRNPPTPPELPPPIPMDTTTGLTQLGSQATKYRMSSPDATMLETFPNQFAGARDYVITHDTDEFTSLCPKTGQPDFARILIETIPGAVCVETKSLKLYLFAYRQEGSFMETLANRILSDLVLVTKPKWMKVTATFHDRGGIATSVVAEHGEREPLRAVAQDLAKAQQDLYKMHEENLHAMSDLKAAMKPNQPPVV